MKPKPLTEGWEASTDPGYRRDPAGGILAVNAAFARKFGRTAAQLVGCPVHDLLHPEDAALLRATQLALARPPHRAESEHRWRTPQGVRWFAWEETAEVDAAGELVAIQALGRDVTRPRLAEEQFYRLSSAVEQSPVAMIITDLEGRAQYVNAKYTEVTGQTLEDLLDREGHVLRDLHPDETAFGRFWATILAGEEWRGEVATTRADGKVVWESVRASGLRNPAGELRHFLCLREDITERKRLEHELRQSHKMESLGTLAGGIAHDFNNLLAIINGYAEFCQQENPDPALLEKSLREIQKAAQRAGGLVRQILTFSRKTEVRFAPMDLNQLARDLAGMMSETFPRTVTFQLDLQAKLPPLRADQNQLQQIVLNLCVNARDAMPSGGEITIGTRIVPGNSLGHLGAEASRRYACLSVADTGTGMSPEVRQRIFEPFFTTKPVNQGTGLGLAVVYGIAAGHGGCIDVESAVGAGSTFRVYLPLTEGAAPTAAPTAPREFPRGTERLLVVDDESALRALLTTALTGKGYQVGTASSGLEAMALIRDPASPFDAVLLDFNMPGANGVEVRRVIQEVRPGCPVIVLSGHLTTEVRMEFEAIGQTIFVNKPYRLDELGRQLRTLLDSGRG